MAKQNNDAATEIQKGILNTEKKYFDKLYNIISSENFKSDLLKIEEEIQRNYGTLASTWNLKNKIKVAAERLVRHHIYKIMMPEIQGIYESPISSDMGVVFEDCVLCVDCKTLDTEGNSTDISYTSVEPNQISFDNSEYRYIPTKSNLEKRSRRERLPVLTYVIKIIYRDDKVNFDISRTTNVGGKPSLVLACIPNGELSNLFDKNIIVNFKTYKYFSENDGAYYTPVSVPADETDKKQWSEDYCLANGYTKVQIPQARGTKDVFLDPAHNCYWVYTSESNNKKIRAIKHGDSMRLNNTFLKERLDGNNVAWEGYKTLDI